MISSRFFRVIRMVRFKFIIAVNILIQAFSAFGHCQAFIADAGATMRTPENLKPFTLYAGEAIRQFMDRRKVPGLSVAITDRNGIIWAASFGVRDTVSHRAVDNETIFGVASVTKPVTATVILKSVEEGILDLDVPVTEYMPVLVDTKDWRKTALEWYANPDLLKVPLIDEKQAGSLKWPRRLVW